MLHLSLRWRYSVTSERLITLVDVPPPLTTVEVAERMYSEYAQLLAFTDILIVRVGARIYTSGPGKTPSEILSPFWRERAPNASVHLLSLDNYSVDLSINCNANTEGYLNESTARHRFIRWLREAELREYVLRSSAIFRSKEGFVYRSPSGKYCSSFLRVGNIQVSRQQLDALAFWLIPHLADIDAVITDTWSISSLTLNALRLVQQHDPTRPIPIAFETLSIYQDGSADVLREAREALSRVSAPQGSRVLLLLSTIMTGGSLEHIKGELKRISVSENFSFLALYRLGKGAEIEYLCDLSDGIEDREFDSLELPPAGATVVEIDPRTYFPLHVEETFVDLGKSREMRPGLEASYQFQTAYQGQGVLSVHRNAVDLNEQRVRHHATYVDVEAMLGIERFNQRLTEVVTSLEKCPIAIVVPPHRAGLAFAQAIQQLLVGLHSVEVPVIVHIDLLPGSDGFPTDILSGADEHATLLVVDDVTTSGQRLARYQAHLRDPYAGRIHYLVGVARPETPQQWEIRQRDLKYRALGMQHTVAAIETLFLPDWHEQDCPWCQELAFLDNFEETSGPTLGERTRDVINSRRRVLLDARTGSGLTSHAFWRPAGHGPPALSNNSMFLPNLNTPTDADVFVAVSAALQYLRIVPKGLHFEYPHIALLHPRVYLGTTFNDAILKMAILRAARRRELTCWKEASENSRRADVALLLAGRGIDESERESVRMELFVAMGARRVPAVFLSAEEQERLGVSGAMELVSRLTGLATASAPMPARRLFISKLINLLEACIAQLRRIAAT